MFKSEIAWLNVLNELYLVGEGKYSARLGLDNEWGIHNKLKTVHAFGIFEDENQE